MKKDFLLFLAFVLSLPSFAKEGENVEFSSCRQNAKFTTENTVYKIKSKIDLKGGTVTIPRGCTLSFKGGSITNGTVVFDGTLLDGRVSFSDVTAIGNVANEVVYPKWFGAKGNGKSNDTRAFQNCVEVSDSMFVEKGTYIVTLQYRGTIVKNGLLIQKSNFSLTFDEGAILKGTVDASVKRGTNGYDGYNAYYGDIIRIQGTEDNYLENLRITGGTFIGVRSHFAQPKGKANEESQSGIWVSYANNVTIEGCRIVDNQGDSIYYYHGENTTINNITSENCRRTGISVGPCKNLVISNSRFINNGSDVEYDGVVNYGTSPCAGICLEGDTKISRGECFENIRIENNYVELDCPTYHTPEGMVFEQRNIPCFVYVGSVRNLPNAHLYITGNEIRSVSTTSDAAIFLAPSHCTLNDIVISGNTYVAGAEVGGRSKNKCLVFTTKLASDKLVIKDNVVHNGPIAYLYKDTSPDSYNTIEAIDIDGNTCYGNDCVHEKAIMVLYEHEAKQLNIRRNKVYQALPLWLSATGYVNIQDNLFSWSTSKNVSAIDIGYNKDCVVNFSGNQIEAEYTGKIGSTLFTWGTKSISRGKANYKATSRTNLKNNQFKVMGLYYLTSLPTFPTGTIERNQIESASPKMKFNVKEEPYESCVFRDNTFYGKSTPWISSSTKHVTVSNNAVKKDCSLILSKDATE